MPRECITLIKDPGLSTGSAIPDDDEVTFVMSGLEPKHERVISINSIDPEFEMVHRRMGVPCAVLIFFKAYVPKR